MSVSRSTLPVTEISSRIEGGVSRVSARVGEHTLWFESNDLELTPNSEAFASAMLLPALDSRRSLTLDQPLSSAWLSNCRQLLRIYNEWWGYDETLPVAPPGDPVRESGSLKTALCFTGGVDSFYTLLRSGHQIDFLVSGIGFVDTPRHDRVRLAHREQSIREVARKTGTQAVFVHTNFLELPVAAQTSWERAHGGLLIGIGHLLSRSAARLLISSSHRYDAGKAWGSSWKTDPLGSSASMQIIHVGAEYNRNEKLWAIADEPLVQRHLHVCWQNLAPVGNCSRCDKCVRTRVQLYERGQLNQFPCFTGEETLADDLNSLPQGDGRMMTYRRALAKGEGDRRVLRALESLIERTERARSEVTPPSPPKPRTMWSLLKRLGR